MFTNTSESRLQKKKNCFFLSPTQGPKRAIMSLQRGTVDQKCDFSLVIMLFFFYNFFHQNEYA